MMTKQHILDEITRTARANAGKPLGISRFLKETGIRQWDWRGKYWVRWEDAVREAGFSPNKLNEAYDKSDLIRLYIELIRELGRIPVNAELRMKARSDPSFPAHTTFSKLGSKAQLISKILEYCGVQSGFEDVLNLCEQATQPSPGYFDEKAEGTPANGDIGYVYLVKSGKHYKIGKTNSLGRRGYELAIQLPEKSTTIHSIKTDDPTGIEAYWHKRFDAKRANGEWFKLELADISAFKRRKFM